MADTNPQTPPPVLDCARLIEYAILDKTVEFSGHSALFVNGNEVGPVPCLAICEDLKSSSILLFHCGTDWNVLGCAAHTSIVDAESRAESIYRGVRSQWRRTNTSREAAVAYL